jgi:hypothetical protein
MRYQNLERKINRKQYFEDICKLYNECDSFEEFKLKVVLQYADISFLEMLAFEIFYFKKTRPFLYRLCWWVLIGSCFCFGWFTIEALLNSLIWLFGFCLFFHCT